MTLFDDILRNRDSQLVQDALTRYCRICGAEAGQNCWDLGEVKALKGKIIHYSRTEA